LQGVSPDLSPNPPQALRLPPPDVARTGAEYIRLVSGAYRADLGLFPGWRRIQTDNFQGIPLHDEASGFDAEIYVNDITGEHVVAFRGTDFSLNLADIRTDALFFNGTDSESVQFKQAVELGKAAKAAYGDNLTFVGSSLGHSLASTAGLATGTRTITAAPIGMSHAMVDMAGGMEQAKANAHLITNFALDGDVSDEGRQREPLLPYRFGETYYLSGGDTGLPDTYLPGPLGELAYRIESFVWLHEANIPVVNELDKIGYGAAGNDTGLNGLAKWIAEYVGASTFRAFQPVDGGDFQTVNTGDKLPPGV
jgi:hypothetical protein